MFKIHTLKRYIRFWKHILLAKELTLHSRLIMSHAWDTEEGDNGPEGSELVSLIQVAILLRVPETRCTHVETTGLFVQDHGNTLHLKILSSYFLWPANDLFSYLIGPCLSHLGVIGSNVFALLIDHLVNDALDSGLDWLELIFSAIYHYFKVTFLY